MFEKLFKEAYLCRLDNIVQWSEMDVFKHESVTQHSFKVAAFASTLFQDIFGHLDPGCMEYDVAKKYKLEIMEYALFHDFDEALIRRDISHEIKYNSFNGLAIRRELDNLTMHYAEDFRDSQSGNYFRDTFMNPSNAAKRFVKLCDWLAMAFFIRREQHLGNQNLTKESRVVYNGIRKAIEDVKDLFNNNEWIKALEPSLEPLDNIMNLIYE